MPKIKYKYTCKYCNYQWDNYINITNSTCYRCKDKNVKCERIELFDYYGEEDKKQEEDKDPFEDWRD